MDDCTSYLAHHGIKGQKWGIRRYQNYDGSLTDEGRKRKGVGQPRRTIKEQFAKRKAEKAAKNAKTTEEEKEELKTYLRKHPKKLPRYSNILSQEDANEIISSINFDRRLQDIKRQEIERGWQKINDVRNRIQTVSSLTATAVGAYNNAALVYNAIYDLKKRNGVDVSGMKKLPQAGWGNQGNQGQGGSQGKGK